MQRHNTLCTKTMQFATQYLLSITHTHTHNHFPVIIQVTIFVTTLVSDD